MTIECFAETRAKYVCKTIDTHTSRVLRWLHKKVPHRNAELFSLRRLDVSFDSLKKIKGYEAHTKSHPLRQKFLSDFFTTPTRLAVGLGTEEVSPRFL